MSEARALVDTQAEDARLWGFAQSAREQYLQAALRRLHDAVERTASPACAAVQQGHPVRLTRACVVLQLSQLADVDLLRKGQNLEGSIAEYFEALIARLWPEAKALSIDHWHISPMAQACAPHGFIVLEVCATLLPVAPRGTRAIDRHGNTREVPYAPHAH